MGTLLLLAALATGGGELARPRLMLLVRSPQLSAPPQDATFRVTEILDLEFLALLPFNVRGRHLLELKVYTPNGHLYQILTTPIASRPPLAAAPRRLRAVSGYPRPLEEQPLVPMRFAGSRVHGARARLPVAGTWIVSSSLYGRWRVDGHLDHSPTPQATRSFVLQP
jgi:hypothetical protein